MLLIRGAELGDDRTLQRIYVESAASSGVLTPVSAASSTFRQTTQGERVVVAYSPDETILGFVSVFEPDAFIHHLYVAPKNQNQGVGKELLNSLNSWLPLPWHLKCVEANMRALRFYFREGWVKIEVAQGPDGSYALLRKSVA